MLAEQNALLALQISLGELQRAMGPDQRVSALSDILTVRQPHRDRDAVAMKQTKWAGVWNAAGGLRNWLVSGNEGTLEAVSPVADASPDYSPADAVDGLLANQSPNDLVTVKGEPGVVMVASGSVGIDDVDSIVVAPRVDVDDVSAYAWWIADEGQKASLNLIDRYEADSESLDSARFLSSQRNAIELLDGWAEFPVSGTAALDLDKLHSYSEVGLLVPAMTDADLHGHFHDLAVHSAGLLTDARIGGLKRDLTYLFELSDADFDVALDSLYADSGYLLSEDAEGATPIAQTGSITPDGFFDTYPLLDSQHFQAWGVGAPSWEQLRSFYRIKDDMTGNGAPVRPQIATEHGIYPTLVQARLFGGISRRLVSNGADNAVDTDDDEMEVYLHTRIMAVLANPYSVDLNVGEMFVSIFPRSSGFKAGEPVSGDPDENSPILESFGSNQDIYNKLQLRISNQVIPAGKALVFTLRPPTASASSGEADLSDINYPVWLHQDEGTYELDNDFDTAVSLRKTLPGGPYTRAETDGVYLWGHQNTNLTVVTWGSNPSDQKTVLQFCNSLGGSTTGRYDHSAGLGENPLELDGDILWGGGYHYILLDVSNTSYIYNHGFTSSNYVREVNWRAPYRPRFAVSNTGGDLRTHLPIYQSSSTNLSRFGDGNYEITFLNFKEIAWGMLNESFAGVDPLYENRFYYLPTQDEPINSLGQLQHFNAAGYLPAPENGGLAYSWGANAIEFGVYGNYNARQYTDSNALDTKQLDHDLPIGNAVASRHIPRERVYNDNRKIGLRHDASWLLNAALWDRFYFSTMPQTGNFDIATQKLLNNRYQPITETTVSADALRASPTAFAENMAAEGSFNVNSTSVDAWKAFLAGTLDVDYQGQANVNQAVFARTPQQAANPPSDGSPEKLLEANAWKGYRSLDSDDIDRLATAIVDQVKLRGPFLSLQHFVNRLPVAATDDEEGVGIRGALEAAIQVAELNEPPVPESSTGQISYFNTMKVNSDVVDAEHGFANSIEGGPGTISQADLLQPLGPYISVRSDTFKIRCSGIAKDPVTGQPAAQVWCEAVVQRVPEFVDATQSPDTVLDSEATIHLNDINLRFGRRFRLVSFRWLDKNEI
ncbi:hypothetical protein SH580_19265 [Coraliomargarita algicola]|uniref:Uncharacterized protein n=1 Tax=Coraliomargarita algicola TaxID=3092156 RepID=A0ABZ0RHC7_9BACT|nr:hypothetical protein [Coraliomargarita sp. J2-16]WPJ95561.1 hypothetical protein SH580_19265 [Coraliomargarita sp. J2-16]